MIEGFYKIPCKDCPSVYFGETGRALSDRVKEHKRDIVNQKPESALASHVSQHNHRFDFDESRLIFKSNSLAKRHIVESALITLYQKNTINNNLGFSPRNKLFSKFIGSLFKPRDLNFL